MERGDGAIFVDGARLSLGEDIARRGGFLGVPKIAKRCHPPRSVE
jgi:hypothetical protein